MSRTYQKSRLFLGLTVEDNLYLGRSRRPAPDTFARSPRAARDGEMRERARELAASVGLANVTGTLVGSLSHGEQRQLEVGMAQTGEPEADAARRAGLRALAWRANRADRPSACARSLDHADPDRARHGRRAARRRGRHDDARRPQGDRGQPRRDSLEPARARPLSRYVPRRRPHDGRRSSPSRA